MIVLLILFQKEIKKNIIDSIVKTKDQAEFENKLDIKLNQIKKDKKTCSDGLTGEYCDEELMVIDYNAKYDENFRQRKRFHQF